MKLPLSRIVSVTVLVLSNSGCGKLTTPEQVQAQAEANIGAFFQRHVPQAKPYWDDTVDFVSSPSPGLQKLGLKTRDGGDIIPQILSEADRLAGVSARLRVVLSPAEYREFQIAWAEFQRTIPSLTDANPLTIVLGDSKDPVIVDFEKRNGLWRANNAARRASELFERKQASGY